MSSSLRVVVRCRPLLSRERDHTCARVALDADGGKVLVSGREPEGARRFAFDRVLSPAATQEDVMREVAPLVDHALRGLHATVFAYGQTGSGKTYTVEGVDGTWNGGRDQRTSNKTSAQQHGIIPRVIQLVFDRARGAQAQDASARFQLRCSFYQIYNERVTDLLSPSTTQTLGSGLKVTWRRGDVFVVENLFICDCDNPEKMRRFFFSGVKEKIMGSHAMNEQSSRSHCVFTIHITRWDVDSPDTPVRSELSIVDLAGSEKLTLLSKNPSKTLIRESIEINASLLALGKVITALSNASKRRVKNGESKEISHVPYRESKLTMLLKHALGGNSLTTMIACISPSDSYVDETLSTLLYANRARNIVNVPRVNEDTKSALVRQLRAEVAGLRKELEYYRALATETVEKTDVKRLLGVHSANDVDSDKKDELAENLIQACNALKDIILVNTQLRDDFDTLKEAKLEVDKRELESNAENLALRERIEMLESIVLKDDFVNCPSPDFDAVVVEESKPATCPLSSDGLFSTGSVAALVKDVLRNVPSSARTPLRPRSAGSQAEQLAPSREGKKSQGRFVSSGPCPSGNTTDFRRRVAASANVRDGSGDRKVTSGMAEKTNQKDRQQRFHLDLRRKLEEYTNRYCAPNSFVNYVEYYGKARQQAPRGKTAPVATKGMESLLKRLPQNIVDAVPQSLKLSSHFGSLAFGGPSEDVAELEQRRQRREAKREALLAQQQALRQNVAQVFANAAEQLDSLRHVGAAAVVCQPYTDVSAGRTKALCARTAAASLRTSAHDGMSRLRAYLESEDARESTGASSSWF